MENIEHTVPRVSFFKRILKFIFWSVFLFILLLVTGISLVFIYEDEVKAVVIKELNKELNTEVRVQPSDIDLTFISTFPKCAVEFNNVTAMESWKRKQNDTLLFAGKIQLKFSLTDLFDKKYNITHISLENCRAYLNQDKKGNVNYEIFKKGSGEKSSDSLKFSLEHISIKDFFISYKSQKSRMKTQFTINDVVFRGKFNEQNYELEASGKSFIRDLTAGKINYLTNKKLDLDVSLSVKNSEYNLKRVMVSLNRMRFDVKGGFHYRDSLSSLDLRYKASELDIESLLSLLPDEHQKNISDYKSSGEFFAEGNVSYSADRKVNLYTKFGINNAAIEYKPQQAQLTEVKLKGELIHNQSESSLRLKDFSANLKGDNIKGDFSLVNFNDPHLELKVLSDMNLENLYSFWPLDTVQKIAGRVSLAAEIKGLVSDIRQNAFSEKVSTDLDLKVSNLLVRFKQDASDISLQSCHLIARERSIKIENLKLIKGRSDIALDGEIPGLFNYLLDKNAPLIIRGKLQSRNLEMEDLIFGTSSNGGQARSEISIPPNLNLILDAEIGKFSLGKFNASDINGNFELKNQKAMVSDMSLKTMSGAAVVNALADASGRNLDVSLQAKVSDLNVKELFTQMNNFGQTTLEDKNINGRLNATIDFTGQWDKKLNPDYNSIIAASDLTIERGELNDFKPLGSLAKFVDVNELKRIKFSTLTSAIEIRKGLIRIPKTTIKNSVLNLDFSGTHSFDNKIDYHIRLLISELLAKKRKADDEFGPVENDPDNRRSAFILMTGTVDNPVIRYDKQGLKEKIKEDMKQEKENLKLILKNEFGLFKKDSVSKGASKADQKFELEKPSDNNPKKKTLELKKKEEEDDDF